MTILDSIAIQQLLPHRYPFLMVDRVAKLEGNRIIGIKNVTMNETYFQGHFPGHPIMPGVLQLEAMAQVAGIVMLKNAEDAGKIAYFMSAESVKWRKPVRPGDTLVIKVELTKSRGKIGKARGVCSVDGEVVGYALFNHDASHIGTYVSPFNTSNPTDAEVEASFDGPVREVVQASGEPAIGTPTRPVVVNVPAPGDAALTLLRMEQDEFDAHADAFISAPHPVQFPQANTVYDVVDASGARLRGYYNSDTQLVLVQFVDAHNVIAAPAVTNTYDAEVLAIFGRQPTPPSATVAPPPAGRGRSRPRCS